MGLYLDVDDSKSAIKAGRDAIKKGELKRPGEINLNIGIAYFELKNFDDSIKYLKKAAKYEKTQRFALRWIKHVEREQARAEQLAAS
jgi:Tetratricopeptide repeat.